MLKKTIIMISLLTSMSAMAATKVNVTVQGMVCSFCSQGITKKFTELGTKDIKVDLANHLVSFVVEDEKKITDEVITKALVDSGYGVEKIEKSN